MQKAEKKIEKAKGEAFWEKSLGAGF